VLFGNGGGNTIVNSNASVSASYSLFENGEMDFTGSNNITGVTTSPFASTASTQLSACSPAINAGNPASVTVASPSYSATALPATDLAGNPRIVGGRVDMGAYEFQGTPFIAITAQPAAGSAICAGGSVSASVSVTGTVSGYQWYRNGAALTGNTSATTVTLSLPSATTANTGSYSVVVTGACNSFTSTAFSLTVVVNPVPVITPSATNSICAGTATTLTASDAITGRTTAFAWTGGASTPAISVSTAGTYSVTATTSGCSSTTSVTLTVNPLPDATITANPGLTICAGTSTTLTATGGTGPALTQWRWSTTQQTSSIPVSPGPGSTPYSVTVSSGAGCSATASVSVQVNTALPPITNLSSGVVAGQVQLSARGVGQVFVWTGPTGYVYSTVFRSSGPYGVVAPGGGSGQYVLTVFDGPCQTSASVTVP
jgi:hypothetical protein